MNHDEIILMLTENERQLLKFFQMHKLSEAYEEEIAHKLNKPLAEISRAALWLENKELAKRVEEKRKMLVLSEKGEKYKEALLPEARLLQILKRVKEADFTELSKEFDKAELNAAIGKLTKLKIIRIEKGAEGQRIIRLIKDISIDELPSVKAFNRVLRGEVSIDTKDREILDLRRRGLIKPVEISKWKVILTEKGKELISKGIPDIEVIDRVTPEVISSGIWKKKVIRWYDVSAPVPRTWGGRKHPLRVIMERIRKIFLEMGFKEMKGPWVEIAFWNMDGMWIPQDHPAREMQATFYLARPNRGIVEDKDLVKLVKIVQENGGDTGSTGWRQPWDENEAMKLLLRTHTTAVTFRVLGFLLKTGKVKPPVKFFSIDRVFRNETIDWKHLAEFHQVEGFVVAENLTLRSLMGYIKEFYRKMGITQLRFKPTYNPYTEPSMEIFAWHEKAGKWIEVGNSGLFRPETLRPYNINVPVIAWGLAVERLAAIIYGINDIRKLVGPMVDIDWIRYYETPRIKLF